MKQVDEQNLEENTHARYEYLAEFIDFDEKDAAAIHASAGYFAPLIPEMVERTYDQLLAYDATARHFVPRQHGYDGPLPNSIEDLAHNSEQIRFRKEHLSRYLMHLVGHAYNAKMGDYLDMVGKMHTPKAGNAAIDVPLVQMNALMGLLSDVIIDTVSNLDFDDETRARTLRAFNKLLWIQNDLTVRHYATYGDEEV